MGTTDIFCFTREWRIKNAQLFVKHGFILKLLASHTLSCGSPAPKTALAEAVRPRLSEPHDEIHGAQRNEFLIGLSSGRFAGSDPYSSCRKGTPGPPGPPPATRYVPFLHAFLWNPGSNVCRCCCCRSLSARRRHFRNLKICVVIAIHPQPPEPVLLVQNLKRFLRNFETNFFLFLAF